MSKIYNKAFNTGVLIGVLFSVGLNFYTLILFKYQTIILSEFEYTMGFPFYWYEHFAILNRGRILWLGVIADILFAVIFSFIVGLIAKFVWTTISEKKLK